MKTITKVACLLIAAGSSLVWGADQRETATRGNYDYELWNQDQCGTATWTIPSSIGSNGGTFTANWNGTKNILFRSGKKWGSNSTQNHTQIGNITINYAATWSTSDNVRYLGVYGWAYYTQSNVPTKRENGSNATFSNQIEYYIIQDYGWNPSSNTDLCGTNSKGSSTIDGTIYDFWVCDRIGQPMLTGSGNFKQFFSIPRTKKTSGTISVTAHFNAWHAVGMYMDGNLYEVAMKIESYTGNCGSGSSGNASVTTNILTIGGSLPSSSSNPSSSSAVPSSSSNPSSSSVASSSSQAKTQATTCKTPLITYPTNTVPSDPYTACFKHTNNKCYVCKIENEGNGNTCASAWVWNGSQIESNLTSGYWYQEVTCPTSSSSSAITVSSSSGGSTPIKSYSPLVANKTFHYYSLKGIPLGATKPTKSGVYIEKHGSVVQKIVVR
ncbi:MAG: glycoside hydrolase family 11 protein [Fibromonadales bacterium]|nr:glycoside hydrolase family 11 protein [Fibromonadales bacterium]